MASWPLPYATTKKETVLADDKPYVWSVHLLRRQARRLPTVAAVIAGALLLGLCLFHSFWLALLPVLAVVFSLSEYLFPIHYSLTAQSARSRHGLTSLEIHWSAVRHAYLTDEGIKLSPLRVRNSRFEPLRGIYFRFDVNNRDAVIAAVKKHLPKEETHG